VFIMCKHTGTVFIICEHTGTVLIMCEHTGTVFIHRRNECYVQFGYSRGYQEGEAPRFQDNRYVKC